MGEKRRNSGLYISFSAKNEAFKEKRLLTLDKKLRYFDSLCVWLVLGFVVFVLFFLTPNVMPGRV